MKTGLKTGLTTGVVTADFLIICSDNRRVPTYKQFVSKIVTLTMRLEVINRRQTDLWRLETRGGVGESGRERGPGRGVRHPGSAR